MQEQNKLVWTHQSFKSIPFNFHPLIILRRAYTLIPSACQLTRTRRYPGTRAQHFPLVLFSHQPYEVGITIPILQEEKIKAQEVKLPAQDHIASKAEH